MNVTTAPVDHKIVSKSQWLQARTELLAKEKELTRLGDELSRQRRELPWTPVEKEYVFTETTNGAQRKVTLADLFAGRSQLATYHFMLGPDWAEGCPGCSYLMDHMNGAIEHLNARDVAFVLVSRAPVEKLEAFKKRMGWRFRWVSSAGTDFNRDFAVSFTKEELATGAKQYNFGTIVPHGEENPGLSFFYQDASGSLFHTYSTYGRGLETMVGTYSLLDMAPLGRNEGGLASPMSWVRHHDKYEPAVQGIESCCHK